MGNLHVSAKIIDDVKKHTQKTGETSKLGHGRPERGMEEAARTYSGGKNKVSTGDYKNSLSRCSSAVISADCTLPFLSSAPVKV